jgi:hypothetical protein
VGWEELVTEGEAISLFLKKLNTKGKILNEGKTSVLEVLINRHHKRTATQVKGSFWEEEKKTSVGNKQKK